MVVLLPGSLGTALLQDYEEMMKSLARKFFSAVAIAVVFSASGCVAVVEPMQAGRIVFAPEALVFDFDREVPVQRISGQKAAIRTEAVREAATNSASSSGEEEPEFFEAMDGSASAGLPYSITSSENNNLWSLHVVQERTSAQSVDVNDKKPLYEGDEQEEDDDEEDDDEDEFYENDEFNDGEIFPETQSDQSEDFSENRELTDRNTILNSLPALSHLKSKSVPRTRRSSAPKSLKKRSTRREHQETRRRQRQNTRDLLLLKGGGDGIHARYSQNGRATPSILNTVDSITLYKSHLGKKPKVPERHRHSEQRQRQQETDGDSGRRSNSSKNPVNGGSQPVPPNGPTIPAPRTTNERISQQRVVEEPPIEVVGHVPRKPLIHFPSND